MSSEIDQREFSLSLSRSLQYNSTFISLRYILRPVPFQTPTNKTVQGKGGNHIFSLSLHGEAFKEFLINFILNILYTVSKASCILCAFWNQSEDCKGFMKFPFIHFDVFT